MTKKQYCYDFNAAQSYSKKEIQELTGLSKNAVSDSLKACGLPTSRRSYTGEELLTHFVRLRVLVDAGATYEEVQQALGMAQATVPDDEHPPYGAVPPPQAPGGGQELANLDEVIGASIAETVNSTVEAAVNDLIDHIPHMAALALSNAAREGKIREAFKTKLREYFATRRTTTLTLDATPDHALPTAQPPQNQSLAWFEKLIPHDTDDDDELQDFHDIEVDADTDEVSTS